MKDTLRWAARTMAIVCKLLALFKQMLPKETRITERKTESKPPKK